MALSFLDFLHSQTSATSSEAILKLKKQETCSLAKINSEIQPPAGPAADRGVLLHQLLLLLPPLPPLPLRQAHRRLCGRSGAALWRLNLRWSPDT